MGKAWRKCQQDFEYQKSVLWSQLADSVVTAKQKDKRKEMKTIRGISVKE